MISGPDDSLIQSMHGGMGATDLHGMLAMADGLNLPPLLMANVGVMSAVSFSMCIFLLKLD